MKVSALGVEEQRVNVLIDFDDPPRPRARLGDGYRVEVRVVIWSDDNVVKVPVGSLFRRGEGWAAFVVEENGRGCGPCSSVSATIRTRRSPAACRPARPSCSTRPTR